MSKNVLMILAVIVTVLAGWLVIQVASTDVSSPAPANNGSATSTTTYNGGKVVEVDTSLNIPTKEVQTSVIVE